MPWNKGIPMKEESKNKLRIKLLGKYAGQKNPMFGIESPMKGKKFSDEHRKKISIALKGKPKSVEHIKNLKESKKNISQETRLKISNARKDKPTWNKGKKMSFESRMKMKEKRKHRVIPLKDSKPEKMLQIALQLHGIEFEKHKPIDGQPDIFVVPNICIFVDGDFFHANPDKYKADDYIIRGQKASDIWSYDTKINHKLNENGFYVMRIWESTILKNVNECAEKIIKSIKTTTNKNKSEVS